MTLSEFKAWFEGFSEGIAGKPTEKQWDKIKAKVAEVNATPVAPVVIREYFDRYPRYWNHPWYNSYYGPAYAYGKGASGGALMNAVDNATGGLNATSDYTQILAQMGRDDWKETTQ